MAEWMIEILDGSMDGWMDGWDLGMFNIDTLDPRLDELLNERLSDRWMIEIKRDRWAWIDINADSDEIDMTNGLFKAKYRVFSCFQPA